MTIPLNKRTVLGGQYWLIGALGSLTVGELALGAALVAAGTYLVCEPELSSGRGSGSIPAAGYVR